MKPDEIINKLKEKFYEMHIEDICEEDATVEFVKDLIEDFEKALRNARVISAYRTPWIENRDNGGSSDGNAEIVDPEEEEIFFKEDLPDDGDKRLFIEATYIILSRDDVTEIKALKIETEGYNTYLVLKKILDDLAEKEGVEWCGMSCANEIFIEL